MRPLKPKVGRPAKLVKCPCCMGDFPSRLYDRYHRRHCWYKPLLEALARAIEQERAAA